MHIAGHRRGGRSPETYPQSPAVGSGLEIPPLSRQRFIDGDTTQVGLDGSVANPFKTIAQFMASRTNVSVADATANYVGWVMPTLAGYVENVAFPAYCSTELRADSISVSGTVINGNVTWANIAGANAATVAVASLHNIAVNGTLTITDDVGAPQSEFIFGGDEAALVSVFLGNFSSNTTTKLAVVLFLNAIVSAIDAGSTTDRATVVVDNCTVTGTITGKGIEVFDSILVVSALTALNFAIFRDCSFNAAAALSISAGSASFDGSSWMSFIGAGGTRPGGDTGSSVLVVGGFDGASVPGADLLADGSNTNVSLDGTGATAGFLKSFSGNHYSLDSLGAPGSVTLKTGGGELNGDTICITKRDFGAFAYDIKDNAGATIATIPSGHQGFVVARFLTAVNDWTFDRGGSLSA